MGFTDLASEQILDLRLLLLQWWCRYRNVFCHKGREAEKALSKSLPCQNRFDVCTLQKWNLTKITIFLKCGNYFRKNDEMVYFAEMRLFLWEPFLCRDKEVICPLSTTGSPRPFTVIIIIIIVIIIIIIVIVIVIVIVIIIITSIVIFVTAINNLSPSLPVLLVE